MVASILKIVITGKYEILIVTTWSAIFQNQVMKTMKFKSPPALVGYPSY